MKSHFKLGFFFKSSYSSIEEADVYQCVHTNEYCLVAMQRIGDLKSIGVLKSAIFFCEQ